MQKLIALIFRILASIPLPILNFIGNTVGFITYITQSKLRKRIHENIKLTGIITDKKESDTLIKSICQETVKSGLELPIAWMRSSEKIVSLFKEVQGWEHIEAAVKENKGLLLITPHIGSYDLAGRYISQHLPFPLTALYKPPKMKILHDLMNKGRIRDKGRAAPTNLQGVKQIIKALRGGEATIVLPDQVPTTGDGVWSTMFGKDAYTMTLAAKLANIKNVTTLFFCGERLPHGKGFALHVGPLEGTLKSDTRHDVDLINKNIEEWILRFPSQYLFSYNRYKIPANAAPKSND